MGSYHTLESWASRLGYIVERTESGWFWHRESDPPSELPTAIEVVEAILSTIRSEYKGDD